jgi:hypothetical protein
MTTTDRPTPNKTLRGAWAKNIGPDFATQYTTPAGAILTLVRYHDGTQPDASYFECNGCGHASNREISWAALAPYGDVVPLAEGHAATCTTSHF